MEILTPEAPFIAFLLLLVAAAYGLFIWYASVIRAALRLVQPQHRKMRPGQAWYILIPLFGQVYQVLLAGYLSESIRAEMLSRGLPLAEQRPTYKVGLAFGVSQLVSFVPLMGTFASIAALVCWIIHWTKVAEYKRTLEAAPSAESTRDSLIFGQQA